MVKRITGLVMVFLVWTLVGVTEKLFFLAFNIGQMDGCTLTDVPAILWHGLPLDMAIAGYLTAVAVLLVMMLLWIRRNVVNAMWCVMAHACSLLYAVAGCANIVLYGYWGFPLDSTPIFYALSSPKDAAASASVWLIIGAVLVVVMLTAAMGRFLCRLFAWLSQDRIVANLRVRVGETLLLAVMGALLFVPIRGGFTVAVNNVGTVYYSENVRCNHAAVNPVFSVMESLTHDNDFSSRYRYLEDAEAKQLFTGMTYTTMRTAEHTDSVLKMSPHFIKARKGNGKVRVVLVILESFSRYIMDDGEGGLKGVTPNLQALTHDGLYFTRFYSNSFRTDRALVSVLSGYPAQPKTSIMKYPHKTNGLYAIARSLAGNGYKTTYVYGGDANFTNMRSYLMATGFGSIVSEDDYPAKDRTGKWGVNDSVLFERALKEITADKGERRTLHVVQTSSSHEPFDVPVHYMENKRLNAFRYTDEHLGRFVRRLQADGDWANTLLVIVPDHAGCYPAPEPDGFAPYFNSIPLLMLGGAIAEPCEVSTIGSQQDIAATLLAMLGIDHSEFTFSKDLFDTKAPHFAFFTFPDAVGMVTEKNHFMFDNLSKTMIYNEGKPAGRDLDRAKAYLQCLFDDIAAR